MITLTETIAFRVPLEVKEKLQKLAKTSRRKRSEILLGWVNEKLELENWQIDETLKAIELADAGEMATADESLAMKRKWKV